MRNFNEARSEYTQYLDKRADWGEERPISFGRKKGYTEVGVCGTGRAHGIVLFALDASDRSFVKGSNVKSGETVFRYATRNSIIGDIFPLVKINAKKGLLYNLTQASSEGEIETAQFETKSSKLKYLRILSGHVSKVDGFDNYVTDGYLSKVDGFDNYVTEQLDEAKQTPFQIMQDIVKNSQAKKIEGKMVDTFTASAITQAYAKVNDKNKKRIETSNLSTLVNLAHKIMGGGSKNEATEMNESMSPAMFADLKKGDRLQITFGSSLAKSRSGSFVVSFKSKSKKYNLEKVTLSRTSTNLKYYLYNRNGKVSMAAGDMAVSLASVVKESVEQVDELTDKQKEEIAKRKAMRQGQADKKKEKSDAKKADAEQKKKDNPNARGEYIDAADKGLIMQLRAAEDISNEKEHPITFRRGKTEKVPHEDVKAVLSFHDALKKPDDKRRLKIQLAKGGATAVKKLADVYRKTAGK